MGKIMLKRYGVVLGSNVALIIVGSILCAIVVNILPISISAGMLFCCVFGAIVGIVFTVLVLVLPIILKIGDDDSFWKKRIDTKKPVKYYAVFLRLLPMIIVSITLLILMIVLYNPLRSSMFNTINQLDGSKQKYYNNMSHFAKQALISMNISALAANWLLFFFVNIIHYRHLTCRKCGCVLYFDRSLISSNSSVRTEYKSKDCYGKVGEIHVNGKKIGDVNGKTGTNSYERKTYSFASHYLDTCLNCANQQNRDEFDAYTGNWS